MGDNGGRLIAPVTNKVSGWIDPLLERGRNGVRQLGNKFEAIGPKAEYSSSNWIN
jgi:broad specificity phosphatase PhoE